ncbi:MAG TPA: LysR family transcriptional regulator [Opitutaceae bacterium]|nr:LysR family transcriptional regulator [Opitutaceae bacterium]HND62661.1 LysR family transcriptional regulator [Opitutaceae bacterium]
MLLTYLRSLRAIVEQGSLNRAAQQLGVTQPTLTRQMQALEQLAGGRLFERSPTGIKLTDAGHVLAGRAAGLLEQADLALADTRRRARGQHDELRIGYLMSAAEAFMTPAIRALRQAHPEVKAKLSELSPAEQLAGLRRGELDVALVGQEGCVQAREFYTRRLATYPALAVLPATHPLAAEREIDLRRLRGEVFVAAEEDHMPGRNGWVAAQCRRAGFRPRPGPEATSITHMFSLVANEPGVTLVPAYLRSFPHPGVELVGLRDSRASWDLLVVWHRGKSSPALRFLVEALQQAARA